MRFPKKGDLALSTNAIVVLIVAVIILGLIITFITQGFSSVTKKFEGEFNQIETPGNPTAREPIAQKGNVVLNPGEEFGWKLIIFNPTTTDYYDVVPSVKCSDPTIIDGSYGAVPPATTGPGLVANSKDIMKRELSGIYEVSGKISESATPGKKTCQIEALGATSSGGAVARFTSRDIILTIKD